MLENTWQDLKETNGSSARKNSSTEMLGYKDSLYGSDIQHIRNKVTKTSQGLNLPAKDSQQIEKDKLPIILPCGRRNYSGLVEILFNVIGTAGFVIGSLLWCFDSTIYGSIIFGLSCLFCGISCCIYTFKFYKANDIIGVYALTQQAIGCFLFTISSLTYLEEDFQYASLFGFLIASILFLTGCILTQVECRSWLGVLAPLFPGTKSGCIPTSLFNSIGSIIFSVGSLCLFSAYAEVAGSWLYEIGSVLFFLASWGDATVWWNMGVTQSEHQQITATEANFASVKFV